MSLHNIPTASAATTRPDPNAASSLHSDVAVATLRQAYRHQVSLFLLSLKAGGKTVVGKRKGDDGVTETKATKSRNQWRRGSLDSEDLSRSIGSTVLYGAPSLPPVSAVPERPGKDADDAAAMEAELGRPRSILWGSFCAETTASDRSVEILSKADAAARLSRCGATTLGCPEDFLCRGCGSMLRPGVDGTTVRLRRLRRGRTRRRRASRHQAAAKVADAQSLKHRGGGRQWSTSGATVPSSPVPLFSPGPNSGSADIDARYGTASAAAAKVQSSLERKRDHVLRRVGDGTSRHCVVYTCGECGTKLKLKGVPASTKARRAKDSRFEPTTDERPSADKEKVVLEGRRREREHRDSGARTARTSHSFTDKKWKVDPNRRMSLSPPPPPAPAEGADGKIEPGLDYIPLGGESMEPSTMGSVALTPARNTGEDFPEKTPSRTKSTTREKHAFTPTQLDKGGRKRKKGSLTPQGQQGSSSQKSKSKLMEFLSSLND